MCGDISCERHEPVDSLSLNPWHDLQLHTHTNRALEEFLDQLVEDYVQSWYQKLLVHDSEVVSDSKTSSKFIHEVKSMIRYAIGNLLIHLKNTDVTGFVTGDLIPAAINHMAIYQTGKRQSKSAQFVAESVLQEYRKESLLHSAVESQEMEQAYVRKLSELLLPHLLPPKYVSCSHARLLVREILSSVILLPIIDSLSDPAIVNKALVALMDQESDPPCCERQHEKVDLLSGYSPASRCAQVDKVTPDDRSEMMTFGISLKQVADDAQLLFLFMQFLKEEGAVNLIQFYLAYEALTIKLLNPDPSDADVDVLVPEVRTLFKSFIDPNSIDCIQFTNQNVVPDVRNILSECETVSKSVSKLRTCESLYNASYEVNSILEKYYLDLFFETSFFLKMVSGPRCSSIEAVAQSLMTPDVIPAKFHAKHRRQGSMTSLKRVVKDSFWPSSDDGLIPPSSSFHSFTGIRSSSFCAMDKIEDGVDLLAGYNHSSVDNLVHDFSTESKSIDGQTRAFKDMKDWSISIPEIGTRLDPSLKYFHVLMIDVKDESGDKGEQNNEDKESQSWRVERRFQEFYTLESKLKEFHGESLLTYPGFYPLPSRNWSFISTPKQTIHFLHSKKQELENFLSSLVRCDKLCGSQLVYNFLSDSAELTPSSITDALSIKRIIKNVPAKLTSEKGQNLDPFIATLVGLAMDRGQDPENGTDDSDGMGLMTPDEPEVGNASPRQPSQLPPGSPVLTTGAFESLLFIMIRVLGIAPTSALVTAFLALESVISRSLDALLAFSVNRILCLLSDASTLTLLLQRSKSAISEWNKVPDPRSGREQRRLNKEMAQKVIRSRLKELFPILLSDEKLDEMAFLFYSIVQHQNLNKQFIYLSLDTLVMRMFPHIVVSD